MDRTLSPPAPAAISRWAWSLPVLVLATLTPAQALAQTEGFPRPEYYVGFSALYEGEFRDAAKVFRSAARSGLRSIDGRWVDSICYHTMLGECLYHLGEPAAAMEEYTAALQLFLIHRNWLLSIQFPPSLAAIPGTGAPAPWGVRGRRSGFAKFPNKAMSAQGNIDLTQTIQQGGVVRPAQYLTIDVTEVSRCIGVALRRRAELLGPNAPHDPLTGKLITEFTSRPAPPNHWSQAWVDCWLGLAYLASDRPLEAAQSLQAGLVVANEFDHPLTAMCLVELGKLAFRQGNFEQAHTYFLEATFPAAVYEQYDVLEEAFRWGALVSTVGGDGTPYAPLGPALAWAQRKNATHLGTSLLLEQAEQALRTDPAAASGLLEQARRAMGRRQMAMGVIGGRLQWLSAAIQFRTGKIDAGMNALDLALKYQQKASPWLYQLAMADRLATSGAVTERVADELYSTLLREPTRTDWLISPQDTLAAWMMPNMAAFEHWFELALRRNEEEKALEITDLMRRRQFLLSLPLGGRPLALRWLLAAPEQLLPEPVVQQRRDFVARYPELDRLAREVSAVRSELDAIPVSTEDPAELERQLSLQAQLAKLSEAQESLLWPLTVSREMVTFAFPPVLNAKQLREQLVEGQVVLSFFATRGSLYVFKIDRSGQQSWRVPGATRLRNAVAVLLRAMGHYDSNFALGAKELGDESWKPLAQQLFRALTNQKSDDTTIIPWDNCQELIIVPQGPLWYLPFEAVPINDGDTTIPLLAKVRVRYAPLVSLTVPDRRPRSPLAESIVAIGKLHPKDPDSLVSSSVSEWMADLPSVRLLPSSKAPSRYRGPFIDRLVVLAQIDDHLRRGPLGFAPIPGSSAQTDSLATWLQLPWGAPQQLVLPGFVTPAEVALKKGGGTGDEIFLATCSMMAAGTRTILISRWRVGGRSTMRLMREYLQEVPHTTPTDAWQRAVQLIRGEEVDLTQESRVNPNDFREPIRAEHPFFWAGYMIISSQ